MQTMLNEMLNNRFWDNHSTYTPPRTSSYPPYNIYKKNDVDFAIELAVAGFAKEECSVELINGQLEISGKKNTEETAVEPQYLHKGISARSFKLKFQLSDEVNVGKIALVDGILNISLHRVIPEEKKPKLLTIE